MALTVQDVIDLEVFRRARPEVIVGGRAMDRPVRWIHISDYPDIADSLHGGEMLLTSGLRIGGDPSLQERFARELAEIGIAAIVLEAGDQFPEVPQPLRKAAVRNEIPLILLRTPAPYVDITETVHGALINSHYEALAQSEEINQGLTDLILEGAGRRQVLRRLATGLRNPVLLEDTAHHLIDCVPHHEGIDTLVAEWGAHSHRQHVGSGYCTVNGQSAGGRCAWVDVTARNQIWGRLHVVELDSRFDELTSLLVHRGAAAVGLTLVAEHDARDWREHARTALIDDILSGTYSSEEDLITRATQLGLRFDDGHCVTLVVGAKNRAGGSATDPRISAAIEGCVRSALQTAAGRAVCAARGEQVVALVSPSRLQRAASDLGEALSADILRRAKQIIPETTLIVGSCAEIPIGGIRHGVQQAELAFRFGLLTARESASYSYADLGFQRLLMGLSEGPELALLVEAELGPLLASDDTKGTDLAKTLRMVLAAPSVSAAARALHIERRSLYHRIERVKSVLGCDLGDPETRIRLTVALEALNFLRLCSDAESPA